MKFNKKVFSEIEGIVVRSTDELLKFGSGVGRPGAALRYAIGNLRARINVYLADGTFAQRLLLCYRLATEAGITVFWMDNVLKQLVSEIRDVNIPYANDIGTENNIVASFDPKIPVLHRGFVCFVKIANTVSGPATLKIDSFPPVPVLTSDNHPALVRHAIVYFRYDGTNFFATNEPVRDIAVVSVIQNSILFALAQDGKILAATEFVSRQDIDAMLVKMKNWHDIAKEYAAAQEDNLSYAALIRLGGATVRYLADAARPLPRMLDYTLFTNMPGLTMSQFIYHDGDRAEELAAENKIVHPLFFPTHVKALSE